jgi:hypothetical protein
MPALAPSLVPHRGRKNEWLLKQASRSFNNMRNGAHQHQEREPNHKGSSRASHASQFSLAWLWHLTLQTQRFAIDIWVTFVCDAITAAVPLHGTIRA